MDRGFHSSGSDPNLGRAPIVDYVAHAPVVRLWMKHHFGKAPTDLNVVFSAESVRAVLTAISCDIGVGVVPQQGKKPSAKEIAFIQFYKDHV